MLLSPTPASWKANARPTVIVGLARFAAMSGAFPTTTGEINAEYLTDALRGSGTIGPEVTVAAIDVDAANAGVGFMGEVATVGLTYAGGGGPATVVAKFPTQSTDIRTMMYPTRIYEREHRLNLWFVLNAV